MPRFTAQIETEVEVEFEVFCGKCGAGLCSNSTGGNTHRRNFPFVTVIPCENCEQVQYDKGFDIGYAQGVGDAQNESK